MKAPSLILFLFLFCMTIVLVALDLLSVHSQKTSNRVLEQVIADLTDRSHKLENELAQLRDVQAKQATEDLVSAPLDPSAGTAAATNDLAGARPAKPQPFQARAYVGRDYLGLAWVIPSNVREHAESGEYHFEPVILIDEKSRKAFTQTNLVEREVVRNNTYNQVYQQPYWYGYPVWVNPRPNPPTTPPPQRPPVVQPTPGRSSTPWAPAIGAPPIPPTGR